MSEEPDVLALLHALREWGLRSNILVRLRGLEDRYPETDLPISEQLQSVVQAADIATKEITRLRSELTACQQKLAVSEGREPDPEIKRLRDALMEAGQRFEGMLVIAQDGADEVERLLVRPE